MYVSDDKKPQLCMADAESPLALDVSEFDMETISTQEHEPKSQLLHLPASLRMRIYEAACIKTNMTLTSPARRRRRRRPKLDPSSSAIPVWRTPDDGAPVLLQLCRQIRHEAQPPFFHLTTLYLDMDMAYPDLAHLAAEWPSIPRHAHSIELHFRDARHLIQLDARVQLRMRHAASFPALRAMHVVMPAGQTPNADLQLDMQQAARHVLGSLHLHVHVWEDDDDDDEDPTPSCTSASSSDVYRYPDWDDDVYPHGPGAEAFVLRPKNEMEQLHAELVARMRMHSVSESLLVS
ncbi:hypothetical protein ACEQ8H_001965 [Pleosporales sp. CAS-2024a]